LSKGSNPRKLRIPKKKQRDIPGKDEREEFGMPKDD
jgi:hypothetical protein